MMASTLSFYPPTSTDSLAALFLRDIDADSDIEELFPAQVLLPSNEGVSRKRTASPSFKSDIGGRKRARSGSASSQHSTISIDDDDDDGASPSLHLRPATSSFTYDPAPNPLVSSSTQYSTWTPSWSSNAHAGGTPSASASAPPAITSGTANSTLGASAVGASAAATSASALTATSTSRTSRATAGPTVRKYVPPPPREGLTVPPSDNPWSF
ncbi:hypothetical protein MVEN_02256400 [Mycena venus]|uniref:Uncharacterized protein n=1 Tax=Mycena venus TaxID=2733690 RepID=A0A8H6X6U7_9AGAR|nr:hypothetical protein MVEN_02256400 [Mycena venus]